MPAEVMYVGPRRVPVRLFRVVAVVALVVAVLVGGTVAGIRIYRIRTDVVSVAELREAYAAFLTPDGRNTVTDLSPAGPGSTPLSVVPAACAPLVEVAFDSQFPPTALQGVSTFQGGGYGYSVSLFSFRFATRAAAASEFDRLRQAATACDHRGVDLGSPFSTGLTITTLDTVVPQTDATLDLLLRQNSSALYQETIVRDKNVLSWQYTFRTGPSAQPEHNLLTGLSSRLRTVDRVGG